MPEITLDGEKAKQSILYICNRMADRPGFGSTLLYKILFYADRSHYVKTGKPITGFPYVKEKFGPIPNQTVFHAVADVLISEDKLQRGSVAFFGNLQKRPIAKADADISVFSKGEIEDLEETIAAFSDATATIASRISHKELAWKIADYNEELPYFTSLFIKAKPTAKDVEWGNKQIETYKSALLRKGKTI